MVTISDKVKFPNLLMLQLRGCFPSCRTVFQLGQRGAPRVGVAPGFETRLYPGRPPVPESPPRSSHSTAGQGESRTRRLSRLPYQNPADPGAQAGLALLTGRDASGKGQKGLNSQAASRHTLALDLSLPAAAP